jgi:isoquinoline 1-oxidoreductase alpha subunit
MITFTLNGTTRQVDADPAKPLLWVIRDDFNMTGTKFGCGVAACGACTIHIDGQPARACQTPISEVAGRSVTTIEGASDRVANAVKAAWQQLDVVQCGYCQSGQIMSAVALLSSNAKPTDADIDAAMDGNICRCGTYQRIRAAIHVAAASLA